PPVMEEAEIPDWLQTLRAKPEEAIPAAEVEEAPPLVEEAEIPDWLQTLRAEPEEAIPAAEVEEAPPVMEEGLFAEEEIEAPDWLDKFRVKPEEMPAPERKAPSWLEEMMFPGLPAEEKVEIPEKPTEEIPSWLEEVELPGAEAVRPAPSRAGRAAHRGVEEAPPVGEGEEALAPAEIPTWLQALRPTEIAEAPPREEMAEAIETRGLLAGIKGILPIEPIEQIVGVPGETKAAPEPKPPFAGEEEANLFSEIIARRPPVVIELEAPKRPRFIHPAMRIFIYFLVALAVFVPLFYPGKWFQAADVAGLGGAEEAYSLIEALPEKALTLVAFDYDPAAVAELDLQAKAFLRHLMSRNVRVAAISLDPTGAGIAQQTLDDVAREFKKEYGKDYVNLGYLPGKEIALRGFGLGPFEMMREDYNLGKPLTELAVMEGLEPGKGIRNFDLIIEMAAGADALRGWVEQVVSPYGIRMLAGVTAAIQPYVMPYRDSGQILAVVNGLPGAAEYEVLLGQPIASAKAGANLGAQSSAHLILILLILLGNMEYLINSLRGKEE
ncbi:MAG: hypothetical protein ACUVV0_15305, partial [Anaerolineae bacterium]